jgi:hypothetical protein
MFEWLEGYGHSIVAAVLGIATIVWVLSVNIH